MKHASIRTKVLQALLLPQVLVVLVTVLIWLGLRELRAAQDWVLHSHEVMQQARALALERSEMEGFALAYLLSGEERFREAYANQWRRFEQAVEALQQTVSDNPEQQARLKELAAAMQTWKQEMDALLAPWRWGSGWPSR